ncbi:MULTISPECIES: type II toxin-antitoxin system VapC family toxin [Nostoc]|uniref:Ribonuclease VapC n=1 Tax=Nostoc paludosum FACHB-159 TaxID=2692908 RepID=A0ABR8KB40_9NOSO|nr:MULTISPECIES: type II toxin-antitoxin system VapC family toxin [Nostoc]MBD2680298.1 type II toxin-antitoxin system VapC family toxin [Nostoc sp. FACHB-857]MBD2735924.1 type II toxin-antitoxin system VapC family toxin [Nostoc paludosum FACHB-159]
MIYLLDTNACIIYLNGRNLNLRRRLEERSDLDIVVCSTVKAELFYGAKRSNNPTRNLALQKQFLNRFISLPFDDIAAEIFGDIRSQLGSLGTPIGPYDLQIAAIALANNLILVTHNVDEFSRVQGLRVEDLEAER